MQGDFSVLYFDPYQHRRGVSPGRNGVLRNVNGVLHQQGRVTLDADLTDNPIHVAGHCYGCTAGQGSSCGGALAAAAE